MFLKKVKNTIQKYNLITKNDTILVGVSGGPDSVTLLYLLNSLKKEYGLGLHIAHLDHMMRKNSYKDAEFVRNLAEKLKIPISCGRVNIKAIAKKGSIEEIARNARLAFFFKTAREIKTKKIALGHNFDDQAETVIMRILRGVGLYGLGGILAKKNISGFEIIRPLIKTKRKEIEAFLKRRGIKPRIDASNKNDIYFRNKIRLKLLPLLEKEYSFNIKEILSNLAESSCYDYEYLFKLANRKISQSCLGNRINLKKFLKLHPAMQRLILRLSIAKIKGNMRRINFQHIKEIEDSIINRPINSIVDLPHGISVVKKADSILFYRR
jgi:tRNA(Ile)-lysidine synthase